MHIAYYDTIGATGPSPSIFLAGPSVGSGGFEKSWRREAEMIFADIGFEGTLYVPEYSGGYGKEKVYDDNIIHWEWERLEKSDAILFWVPRTEDMPGFTTNIEFGRYISLSPERCALGVPGGALRMRYIKALYYRLTGKAPSYSLEGTCRDAMDLSRAGKGKEREIPSVMSMSDAISLFRRDATQISAWGDGQHRTAYGKASRVIVNHKSADREAEVLVITPPSVFRYTIDGDDLKEERSDVGEYVDAYGRPVRDGIGKE